MFKPLIALVALTASTSAFAQIGPEIAYAKQSGSGFEIYLVNSNGTGLVRLYRGAAKKLIAHLDIKPGGGEIAFVEGNALKTLTYNNSGVATGAPTIINSTCYNNTVDYSPDGSSLLYTASCNQVGQVLRFPGTGDPLAVTGFLSSARWLRDGLGFLYVANAAQPGTTELRKRMFADGAETVLLPTEGGKFDVSRSGSSLLVTNGQGYTSEYSIADGSLTSTPNFITGTDGHYSPTDDRILYETRHVASGDYLIIRQSSGSISRLTGKGEYSAQDWRPN